MEYLKKVHSEVDPTIKYVFKLDGKIVEFNYIDNGTGKDIICVPCQTMCNMSCRFCHLTQHVGKILVKNLTFMDIREGVDFIVKDLNLGGRKLLISFMGSGEPMDNVDAIIDAIMSLKGAYGEKIRFGLATMMPKKRWFNFFRLVEFVQHLRLDVKIHLSLHFTEDEQRKEWMPSAMDINTSLNMLDLYATLTGNPTEVHYTVIDGVNNRIKDIGFLVENIHPDTTIKLMMYSEREELGYKKVTPEAAKEMRLFLLRNGMKAEYYEPPGNDIGASCGQFKIDFEKEETL